MAETAGCRSGVSHPTTKSEKNPPRFNAAQPIEKSRFGRDNPRKSKLIRPHGGGLRRDTATAQVNPKTAPLRPLLRRLDVREGDLDQGALLTAALDRKLGLVGFDQRLGQ